MEREIFEPLVQKLLEDNLLADSRYLFVGEQGIFLYAVSKSAINSTLQDQAKLAVTLERSVMHLHNSHATI